MLDANQTPAHHEQRLGIPYDTAPFEGTLAHKEKGIFHGQIAIENQTGKKIAVHVMFHLQRGGYWLTFQDLDSPLSITANFSMVSSHTLVLGDDGHLYLIQS